MPQVATLDDDHRALHLERSRYLAGRLHWEATHGYQVTGEMVGAISGHIAYMTLGLDVGVIRPTRTVVVHPTTMVLTGPRRGPSRYTVTDEPLAVLGHTSANSPMFIAWDAVQTDATHPERGRNVVFHEFAHRLDLLGGMLDGMPPLANRDHRRRWISVCQAEFDTLTAGAGSPLLRTYAATNPAEFFAVATEVFLTLPAQLSANRPALYDVFRDYYRQDPAARAHVTDEPPSDHAP